MKQRLANGLAQTIGGLRCGTRSKWPVSTELGSPQQVRGPLSTGPWVDIFGHFRYLLDILHIVVWQQSRNVAFEQSRNVVSISERSLPFPLARIVLLAAEPVKASLRRAQNRRAALTEPAASKSQSFLTRGNGSLWNRREGTFLLCYRGGHFYFAATLKQPWCRSKIESSGCVAGASARPAILSCQDWGSSHRGRVPSRLHRGCAPEGSLDGWPRCKTLVARGNGRVVVRIIRSVYL